MNLSEFTASKYLSKSDLPEPGMTLTIASFGVESFKDGTKKPFVNWVQLGVKPMLLAKINIKRLAAICGTDQSEAMIGRQVHVYNDPMVEMAGQIVGGLRIRPVANPAQHYLGNAVELGRINGPPAEPQSPATPALTPAHAVAASGTQTASERELMEALALVRSRADAVTNAIVKADPNDDIPF
jgi:hypothetical protein